MVEFKISIADPKTGKCMQKVIGDPNSKNFVGMKIGDIVKGEIMDLTGYEFQITGGSDYCGFPMRKGISGARKRILVEGGVGFKGRARNGKRQEGMKVRKTVCGENVTSTMVQINLKIIKQGKTPLFEEKKEEKSAKEATPEKKEAPKKEEKKEE